MTVTRISNPASPKQVNFIKKLLDEKQVESEAAQRLRHLIDQGTLTGGRDGTASQAINWLLVQPRRVVNPATFAATPVTEPGIYEHDGKIYKVQYNKTKTNLYAKVLTMTIGEAKRLTAAGSTVKAEYVYAPGAFREIDASHRITGPRAEELSIVFNNCIVCGRHLKAADSVKAGIGPVCRNKV